MMWRDDMKSVLSIYTNILKAGLDSVYKDRRRERMWIISDGPFDKDNEQQKIGRARLSWYDPDSGVFRLSFHNDECGPLSKSLDPRSKWRNVLPRFEMNFVLDELDAALAWALSGLFKAPNMELTKFIDFNSKFGLSFLEAGGAFTKPLAGYLWSKKSYDTYTTYRNRFKPKGTEEASVHMSH